MQEEEIGEPESATDLTGPLSWEAVFEAVVLSDQQYSKSFSRLWMYHWFRFLSLFKWERLLVSGKEVVFGHIKSSLMGFEWPG